MTIGTTPAYLIKINGQEFDGQGLQMIELVDTEGIDSDELTLTFDNRGYRMGVPPKGAPVEVWLGYLETGLVYRGTFKIADYELEESVEGGSLQIVHATSADFKEKMKEPVSETHEETTLEDLLKKTAGRHDLGVSVSADLGPLKIDLWVTNNESDMHTWRRLGRRFDALIKPVNGKLVAVPKGKGLAPDGSPMPSATINPTMCSKWRAAFKDRPKHKKVEGQYLDKGKGRREPVRVEAGEGEATFVLPQVYGSKAEAERAAKSRSRELQRKGASFTFTCPADPTMQAESIIDAEGFPDEVNGSWLIKQVTLRMVGALSFTADGECEPDIDGTAGGKKGKKVPGKDGPSGPRPKPGGLY